MRLYNSLTNQEERFTPIDTNGKIVRFYTCGPTVYDYAHIGNFRSFLNADLLRRTLELLGHTVIQVMNLTDVGHMSDDDVADGGGEDKMQLAAKRLTVAKKSGTLPQGSALNPDDPYAIAEFYASAFLQDAAILGLKVVTEMNAHPERLPRPTNYIPQMIAMVQRLINKGHAYVGSDGAVYFDIGSYKAYGELSGNTPEKIRSGEGGRVNASTQGLKKHPADFMLWKPDKKHLMRWDSPWGEGYPGWHLECSAMAQELLSQDTEGVIDLHSGGEDNIFPHHECEIAQSCCSSGANSFARYWFHTRFLIVEGEKMSKSKGNFFTVRDLLKKGASPAAIRLELIRTHYRSHANFTFQGLKDSQRQVERWTRLRVWLQEHASMKLTGPGVLGQALTRFRTNLESDLNISGAIAALNTAASVYDTSCAPHPGDGDTRYADELIALNTMDSVLGVFELDSTAPKHNSDSDVALIEEKIAARNAARKNRDWAGADRLRDELQAMGIAIKDNPDGTSWTRIVG